MSNNKMKKVIQALIPRIFEAESVAINSMDRSGGGDTYEFSIRVPGRLTRQMCSDDAALKGLVEIQMKELQKVLDDLTGGKDLDVNVFDINEIVEACITDEWKKTANDSLSAKSGRCLVKVFCPITCR